MDRFVNLKSSSDYFNKTGQFFYFIKVPLQNQRAPITVISTWQTVKLIVLIAKLLRCLTARLIPKFWLLFYSFILKL